MILTANIAKSERVRFAFDPDQLLATATIQRKVAGRWQDAPGGPHYCRQFELAGFHRRHVDAWSKKMVEESGYRAQYLVSSPDAAPAPGSPPAPPAAAGLPAAGSSLADGKGIGEGSATRGPSALDPPPDPSPVIWAGWPGPPPPRLAAASSRQPAGSGQPASEPAAGQAAGPGETESCSIKAISSQGFDCIFTVKAAGESLGERVLDRLAWLGQNGFRPTFTPESERVEPLPLPQAAEPVIPTQIQPLPLIGQPGAPAPLANGQPAPAVITPAALVFEAELLTCAFDEAGKLMFKVRGGPKFKRFGVRCWPETLEAAGIDPAALVAGGQYSLAGWVAHWQEGDVAGKGQKVTRLERL